MASFFNLTLDTLAPAGLTAKVNDDALYTTTQAVTLKLTLADADTTGYQMKIWGIDGADDEASAPWETYTAEKSVTLPSGDGLKTVSVKVRDSVGNASASASDTITLNTVVPEVSITGPDKSVISKVDGFDSAVISFSSNVVFDEYKVCVVPATNSLQGAGTVIPSTGGSENTSGSAGNYPADQAVSVTIRGADLEAASSGDGQKIVKVFVKNVAGTWSVA